MKRIFVVLLASLCALQMLSAPAVAVGEPAAHTEGDSLHSRFGAEIAASAEALGIEAVSALLMEESTGTVLYESNADSALPPASVTKIMTLLLVMEAIDGGRIRLTDTVTVSAHAASMGGSQVFLKEGEQMSVEDLLKSVVIASANDAAVALAEYVAGSEDAFVMEMNRRAAELGAVTAKFENTNGLDDTSVSHVMSARDIAILSRALIAHRDILKYSSIWMDTIRDGAFGLTNTNRLVRFYPGCTGLKTGSTSKAGFCVSVTAERDGLSLICVIMGSPSRDARNSAAQKLLDWGFASFAAVTVPGGVTDPIPVTGGSERFVSASYPALSVVVPKAKKTEVRQEITCLPSVSAPVSAGQRIGEIVCYVGETELLRRDITIDRAVPRVTYIELFCRLLRGMLLTAE